MTWSCRECGQPNDDAEGECAGCGLVRLPDRIVLVSQATGRRLSLGVSTAVGRRLLASFAGPEAAYAAEPQFEIVRQEERWIVRHVPTARNPTFWNGEAMAESWQRLENGGTVSLGPHVLKLRVEFRYGE